MGGSLFQKQPGRSQQNFLLGRIRYCQPEEMKRNSILMDVTTICGRLIEPRWNVFFPRLFAQFLHRRLTGRSYFTVCSKPMCGTHGETQECTVCWWCWRWWWWWWCMHLLHYTVKQWLPGWFGNVNETLSIISPLIFQWLMRSEINYKHANCCRSCGVKKAEGVYVLLWEHLALIFCSPQVLFKDLGFLKKRLKG